MFMCGILMPAVFPWTDGSVCFVFLCIQVVLSSMWPTGEWMNKCMNEGEDRI